MRNKSDYKRALKFAKKLSRNNNHVFMVASTLSRIDEWVVVWTPNKCFPGTCKCWKCGNSDAINIPVKLVVCEDEENCWQNGKRVKGLIFGNVIVLRGDN